MSSSRDDILRNSLIQCVGDNARTCIHTVIERGHNDILALFLEHHVIDKTLLEIPDSKGFTLTHLTTYSLTHLTTYSLTHLTTYSLTHSLRFHTPFARLQRIQRLRNPPIDPEESELAWWGHSLTHSLTYSLTHSLTYLLTSAQQE